MMLAVMGYLAACSGKEVVGAPAGDMDGWWVYEDSSVALRRRAPSRGARFRRTGAAESTLSPLDVVVVARAGSAAIAVPV